MEFIKDGNKISWVVIITAKGNFTIAKDSKKWSILNSEE